MVDERPCGADAAAERAGEDKLPPKPATDRARRAQAAVDYAEADDDLPARASGSRAPQPAQLPARGRHMTEASFRNALSWSAGLSAEAAPACGVPGGRRAQALARLAAVGSACVHAATERTFCTVLHAVAGSTFLPAAVPPSWRARTLLRLAQLAAVAVSVQAALDDGVTGIPDFPRLGENVCSVAQRLEKAAKHSLGWEGAKVHAGRRLDMRPFVAVVHEAVQQLESECAAAWCPRGAQPPADSHALLGAHSPGFRSVVETA